FNSCALLLVVFFVPLKVPPIPAAQCWILLFLTLSRGSCTRQFLLDQPREGFERLGPYQRSPVNEESWCASNPQAVTLIQVPLHRGFVGTRCKTTVELCDINPDLSRVTPQIFGSQLGRLGKKHVVIFPKLSLVLSAARRLCRAPRLWMNRIQREIPIRKPYLARIALEQLFQCRMGLLAERAFKVGEFHNGHRRIRRATNGRAVGGDLDADCSRWLETDNNLTLRAERFHEGLPASG